MTNYSALHYSEVAKRASEGTDAQAQSIGLEHSAKTYAALSAQYANDKINQTHISNCITYIPQDIKLELSDGTITLKAGSKLYLPNGFEQDGTTPKFDEVVVTNDLTKSDIYPYTGKVFIMLDSYGPFLLTERSEITSSGSSPGYHDQYGSWYDTTTNTIKRTTDSGSTWNGKNTLPIAICSYNNGLVSIDQVFNGFGYIGSTVFALPGVKALAPNGRNADGTLNNSLCETSAVTTLTYSTDTNYVHIGIRANGTGVTINGAYKYDEIKNIQYNASNIWTAADCGAYRISGGKVTNFNQKTAFRALDWSDKRTITSWGEPDFTSGVSLASGNGTQYPCFVHVEPVWNGQVSDLTTPFVTRLAGSVYAGSNNYKNDAYFICDAGTTITFTNATCMVYKLKGV